MSGRRSLPHDPPRGIDPAREIFFITICTQPRGLNQLAQPQIFSGLLATVEHRHFRGEWFALIFLFMPDHIHALLSFPPEAPPMAEVIRRWKRWTARNYGIKWQRDFFDHRLRRDESAIQKMDYILQNPVRAGLVATPTDWPYKWQAPEPYILTIEH